VSLSVVVPNFNHAKDLPRALGALLRQKSYLDEIIVVDDASTDSSVEVIEEHQRDNPIVRLIRHRQNRGAPAALNTGLSEAKGDFIYFAAADDFVLGSFFSVATAALTQYPEAAYFCGNVVLVDQNDDIIGFRPLMQPGHAARYISATEACTLIHTIDNWAVGQSVVYRRKFLLEIGGFDEALGSFCDGINYRLLAFRRGFYFSNELTAAWDVRRDSLSAQSALSPAKSSRLIPAAKERIASSCPASLGQEYPELFARRLRFNMARFALLSPETDVKLLTDLVALGSFDHRLIAILGTKTSASRFVILSWLAFRLRPFGFIALVRAGIDYFTKYRRRRAIATRAIAAAIK
jgi:glycosyltransferase involved in cell wall biosynthesis